MIMDHRMGDTMCTNFKTKTAKDGSVVVGRSLEFPNMLPTAIGVLPADYAGQSLEFDGKAGKSWQAKYGVVGMSGFGKPGWLLDGLNTEGVSAHLLYMPGFCTYQAFKGDGSDLSEVDLIAYLLGTCNSVAEVKAAVADVNVWGFDPGMGFAPPMHCLVHDKTASVAIEFRPDGMSVVDNPTGVGTNSPYMDWHLTNLNNYAGRSAVNPGATTVDGTTLAPLGEGQGLIGLPGDYTPPSRFVRAFTLVQLSDQPKDSADAEQTAVHIINSFDIVPGLVQETMGPDHQLVDEVTCWDVVVNLTGQRYAYRTVSDPNWYVVDLSTTNFSKPACVVPLNISGNFQPITV